MQGLGDNMRSILDRSTKFLHFPSSMSYPKVTQSNPKVTYSDPKVTFSGP